MLTSTHDRLLAGQQSSSAGNKSEPWGVELRTAKFVSHTKVYAVTGTVERGYASNFIHVAHLFILTRHLQIKLWKYGEHFKMRKPRTSLIVRDALPARITKHFEKFRSSNCNFAADW